MKLPGTARLSRFLTQSNHHSGGCATYKAFMPPPDLELSTYHTDDLSDNEIQNVAATHVLPEMAVGRSIYGCADLTVEQYEEKALEVDRDDIPERHTTVTGWPTGNADDKAAHRDIAIDLASAASLKLFPSEMKRR
jgi:hypothetical protein